MNPTIIQRLGFPSSMLALILSLSSCGQRSGPLTKVAEVPATAALMVGFFGLLTVAKAISVFETEERERKRNRVRMAPSSTIGQMVGKELQAATKTKS